MILWSFSDKYAECR